MRTIFSLCIIALASARPGQQDKGEDVSWVAGSCLVEHWDEELDVKTNMENVNSCLDCWRQVGDPETEEDLAKAKVCTQTQLPMTFQACTTEIDAVNLSDEQTVLPVLKCFKEFQIGAGAEHCLGKIPQSADPIDTLTDGSMCMIEFKKNVTMFERYVSGGNRKGKKINMGSEKRSERKELNEYVMGTLLPNAHCQAANTNDPARQTACKQCFVDAVLVNPEDVMKEIISCSQNYLLPDYQICHDLLVSSVPDFKANKREVMKCYIRTLLRHVVSECNPEPVTDVNPATLLKTMGCGKSYIMEWIQANASEKFASKMLKKLARVEEDEEDEEDDTEGSE
jgi:hypothetical protein